MALLRARGTARVRGAYHRARFRASRLGHADNNQRSARFPLQVFLPYSHSQERVQRAERLDMSGRDFGYRKQHASPVL